MTPARIALESHVDELRRIRIPQRQDQKQHERVQENQSSMLDEPHSHDGIDAAFLRSMATGRFKSPVGLTPTYGVGALRITRSSKALAINACPSSSGCAESVWR